MRYRQARYDEPLLMEMSSQRAIPTTPLPEGLLPDNLARSGTPDIPAISERDLMRHFTRLAQMNYGVDVGMYPLGSCTMKYNPRLSEEMASLPGSWSTHPLQPEETVQGTLQIMYELQEMLAVITGTRAVSLQPAAGAHGEFTGLLITKAYHEKNGDQRTDVVLPDTSHGTNPASAAMAGYNVVTIGSKEGRVDIEALAAAVNEKTAAFMLTNPNTLGIFESEVEEIARIVHESGALLYYDGANMNAIMGKTTPGKMGFDIVHLNLHKTFSTPHGGGGPGSGPVGVVGELTGFLPVPLAAKEGDRYFLNYDLPDSIGKVHGYYGNWGVLLKAYTYVLLSGSDGLTEVAERSVLNSNYLKALIQDFLEVPYPGLRKHEFVASGARLKGKGLRTMDLAKRLIDYGFHPPTVYFPLVVEEALMVEPTESESKVTLDAYARAVANIMDEPPELLHEAPHNSSVRRVNETEAVKNLILSYRDYMQGTHG
jgi:glycine dehydrogenase subunit 2